MKYRRSYIKAYGMVSGNEG